MPERISSLHCLAAILISTLVATSSAQWTGSGTEADPFLISSAADFNALGEDSDHWDKHFRLTGDIDMGGAGITPVIGPGSNYNDDLGFSGVLDGAGFALDNLVSDVGGVIGINYGVIRNLGLRQPQITVDVQPSMAAIAAENVGLVENCYVDGGAVIGGSSCGGICGINAREGRIEKCWTSCRVVGASGSSAVEVTGGIVGSNHHLVIACQSSATLSGEGFSGGIAGRSNDGAIVYCYSNVIVQRDADFGGIVGHNRSTISHCYSAVTLDTGGIVAGGIVGIEIGGRVEASFWDREASGITAVAGGGTPLTTAEMQSASTFEGAGWELIGSDANGGSEIWSVPVGGYPKLWWELDPVPAPAFAGGSGTSSDPLLIETAAQWKSIGRRSDLLDAHYRVGADLDLTGVTNASIGSRSAYFRGTLDGDNHSISGFATLPTQAHGSGLFAGLHGATVRDLRLESPNVNGADLRSAGSLAGLVLGRSELRGITVNNATVIGNGHQTGGLVGWFRDSIMDDCHINGGTVTGAQFGAGGIIGSLGRTCDISDCSASCTVTAVQEAGGLFGTVSWGPTTIHNCHASGEVSGGNTVGGFVGSMSSSSDDALIELTECSATGNVTGGNSVGGFCGWSSGLFQRCFATGDATGSDDAIGGFVGYSRYSAQFFYCYARGDASGPEAVGGFVGSFSPNWNRVHIQACYSTGASTGGGFVGRSENFREMAISGGFWNISTSGTSESAGGIGLFDGAMRSRSSFDDAGWDFDGTWTIAAGEYPTLRWQAGDLFNDSDADGLPDEWETEHYGSSEGADPNADDDGDGVSNADEYKNGTDPHHADSDIDGFDDQVEIIQMTDPLDASSRPPALTQRLVSREPVPLERFGHDVAISGDTLVVGAPGSVPTVAAEFTLPDVPEDRIPGSAYVFRRSMTTHGPRWVELLKLEPNHDFTDIGFGSSVDIDGDTVIVGCWSPAAYVFDLDNPEQPTRFDVSWIDPDAEAGPPRVESTLDVAIHRDTVLIGSPTDNEAAPEAGAAFLFRRDRSGSWEEAIKLFHPTPKDLGRLGVGVALHGNSAAIGSGPYGKWEELIYPARGSVVTFRRGLFSGEWSLEKEIAQPMALRHTVERFGSEISLHRGTLAVSGINSNNDGDYPSTAAALFGRHKDGFAEWGELATPDVYFDFEDRCWCYQGPFTVATRNRTLLIGTTTGTNVLRRRFLDFENWNLVRRYYPSTLPAPAEEGGGFYGSAVDLSGVFIVAGAASSEAVWVTPLNEPAPFLEWLARFFSDQQMDNPEIAALSADPDDDGLDNELEFALGLDPSSADEDEDFLPSISFDTAGAPGAECLTFTFSLPEPMPDGITHSVQASTNLVDWATIATRAPSGDWTGDSSITEHVATDGRLCVTVHDTVEISEHATRYLRLGVQVAQ